MKAQYRIKPYDLVNDIWILQKRVFLCFWTSMGAGSQSELVKKRDELNSANVKVMAAPLAGATVETEVEP